MDIVKFNGTQIEALSAIVKLRSLSESILIDLPQIGYLAYDENVLIAAGFLRKCEGNYAIFDGLITNPKVKHELRNESLDLIVDALLIEAKILEIHTIIAWTSNESTLKRAMKFGFSCSNQTLIGKRID